MANNEQRQLGRAKNSVLNFLEGRLSVPRIYIDAVWAGQPVDVLAIDRDGVGAVHVALLFADESLSQGLPNVRHRRRQIEELHRRFQDIPAQFKYVVAVEFSQSSKPPSLPPDLKEAAFSPDGLGRIGFAFVDFPRGDEPVTKLLVKPERFRAKVAQLADEFVEKHMADWEIRA
jgi:hypothetical protein